MNIIVTGGAGYIGSHVCKELKKNKFNPIVIDDLSGGYKKFVKWGPLEVANINSYKKINYILKKYKPKGIIHLAGKISVEDSFLNPNKYYYNNLDGSLNLIYCMQKNNIKKIIFSSSAAVYGKTKSSKIKENTNKMPISPYAHSKLIIEKTLEKYKKFHNFSFISLRYFNVAGADKNLEIGEAHFPETHLIPLTIEAAYKKKIFKVYGKKYNTKDGTCLRDYVHVTDVARAHVLALKKILKNKVGKFINLGNGKGFTVLDIIKKVEKTMNIKIKKKFTKKRKGDLERLVSDISLSKKYLNWSPYNSDLDKIINSSLKWYNKNYNIK